MLMVEEQLAHTCAFIADESFALADIVIGLSTNRWFMTTTDRPELPAVQAYNDRLTQRRGYQVPLMHESESRIDKGFQRHAILKQSIMLHSVSAIWKALR